MGTTDVEETLELAVALTGVTQVKVTHRPRLLSDNEPAFVSKPLAQYLKSYKMKHVRGRPHHPKPRAKSNTITAQ